MTPDHSSDDTINRRKLLRSGTLVAGAGAAVLASTVVPRTASAADGDEFLVGRDNEASSTTSLIQGGTAGSSNPTLSLGNANGPALRRRQLLHRRRPRRGRRVHLLVKGARAVRHVRYGSPT